MTPLDKEFAPVCPVPINRYPAILLAHGGGGRLMQQLLDQVILPAFANPALDAGTTAAVVDLRRPSPRLHDGLVRGAAAVLSRAATSARWRSTAR